MDRQTSQRRLEKVIPPLRFLDPLYNLCGCHTRDEESRFCLILTLALDELIFDWDSVTDIRRRHVGTHKPLPNN